MHPNVLDGITNNGFGSTFRNTGLNGTTLYTSKSVYTSYQLIVLGSTDLPSADSALLLLVDCDAILLASYKINKPETGPDAYCLVFTLKSESKIKISLSIIIRKLLQLT